MEENAGKQLSAQQLVLTNRKHLTLSGVSDIENYAQDAVTVLLHQGALYIEGEGLHISALSLENGTLTLDGVVSAMVYTDAAQPSERKSGGLFERLFR